MKPNSEVDDSLKTLTHVIEILVVEDDRADVRIIQEVFKDARIANKITVLNDGETALDYIRNESSRGGKQRPDLILLDLNLPKMSGHEILVEIKKDPEICMIPVVILSSSGAEQDVNKSYALQASCHAVKPIDFHKFIAVLGAIEKFYLCVARLPNPAQ